MPAQSNTQRTNLVQPLTRFIGREQEEKEVRQWLASTRLLTLTGPGGCGKTRLALHAASACLDRFRDGISFVDLASLTNPGLIAQAIASALLIAEQPGSSNVALDFLKFRELLLILDNCEHLISACAPMVETMLQHCPRLQILVTSREALHIHGETLWSVPPLSLPDIQNVPMTVDIIRFEAIQLFLERAVAVLPAFRLTPENAEIIAQICHRLDGMPLAIELAAARVNTFSVTQIAARLDDRFHLLADGSRTALPRLQTLETMMNWSYELLPAEEQELFRRLAVFTGSFSLEAAEAICVGKDLARQQVLAFLPRLVNKSLLQVVQRTGEARYRLLETIRHYGLEKLKVCGELKTAQEAHRNWYGKLAELGEAEYHGAYSRQWLDTLALEYPNVQSALEWTFSKGEIASAVQLSLALLSFWRSGGHLSEGQRWLELALESEANLPTPLRARALQALGMLCQQQSDLERALVLQRESLQLFHDLDDKKGLAIALQQLGLLEHDVELAFAYLRQSQALFLEIGDKRSIALVISSLGMLETWQGNLELARLHFEESLALRRSVEDKAGIASCIHNLGYIASRQGDLVLAAILFEESLALSRELEYPSVITAALHNLGCTRLELGSAAQARLLFEEGLSLAWRVGIKGSIMECLEGLAGVAVAQGQAIRAAHLLASAESLRRSLDIAVDSRDRHLYERWLTSIHVQVDDQTLLTVWAEGQSLPIEQAIAYALNANSFAIVHRETKQLPAARKYFVQEGQNTGLRLLALGSSCVYRGEERLPSSVWTYTKSRELLFYLLCHPSRTKEQVSLALWPDATPEFIRSTFRVVLYYLRQALGHSTWILYEKQQYTFNRQLPYWFDVEAFDSALAKAQALHTTSSPLATYGFEEALMLYKGNFLEDFGVCDWILPLRETFQRRYLEALSTLGQIYFAQGNHSQAASTFQNAIAHDRYCETAHRGLMRCYVCLGERGQALHHYYALCEQLRGDLALTPDPETIALFEELRRDSKNQRSAML